MKAISVTAAIIILCSCVQAQVPGYMGKKLSFYYAPSIFLSFKNPSWDEGIIGINLRNDFAADYVVSKSVSVGASAKFVATKLDHAFYYTTSNGGYVEDAYSGDVQLKGTLFSVYLKNFAFQKRGFLAPVGVYRKFEFVYGKVKGHSGDLVPVTDLNYHFVSDFDELHFKNEENIFGFIFSFGRQSLFFDRLFVNTGGSIGFLPSGLFSGAGLASGDEYYGNEQNYKDDVQVRTSRYFLFNIDLGVGVLLF